MQGAVLEEARGSDGLRAGEQTGRPRGDAPTRSRHRIQLLPHVLPLAQRRGRSHVLRDFEDAHPGRDGRIARREQARRVFRRHARRVWARRAALGRLHGRGVHVHVQHAPLFVRRGEEREMRRVQARRGSISRGEKIGRESRRGRVRQRERRGDERVF